MTLSIVKQVSSLIQRLSPVVVKDPSSNSHAVKLTAKQFARIVFSPLSQYSKEKTKWKVVSNSDFLNIGEITYSKQGAFVDIKQNSPYNLNDDISIFLGNVDIYICSCESNITQYRSTVCLYLDQQHHKKVSKIFIPFNYQRTLEDQTVKIELDQTLNLELDDSLNWNIHQYPSKISDSFYLAQANPKEFYFDDFTQKQIQNLGEGSHDILRLFLLGRDDNHAVKSRKCLKLAVKVPAKKTHILTQRSYNKNILCNPNEIETFFVGSSRDYLYVDLERTDNKQWEYGIDSKANRITVHYVSLNTKNGCQFDRFDISTLHIPDETPPKTLLGSVIFTNGDRKSTVNIIVGNSYDYKLQSRSTAPYSSDSFYSHSYNNHYDYSKSYDYKYDLSYSDVKLEYLTVSDNLESGESIFKFTIPPVKKNGISQQSTSIKEHSESPKTPFFDDPNSNTAIDLSPFRHIVVRFPFNHEFWDYEILNANHVLQITKSHRKVGDEWFSYFEIITSHISSSRTFIAGVKFKHVASVRYLYFYASPYKTTFHSLKSKNNSIVMNRQTIVNPFKEKYIYLDDGEELEIILHGATSNESYVVKSFDSKEKVKCVDNSFWELSDHHSVQRILLQFPVGSFPAYMEIQSNQDINKNGKIIVHKRVKSYEPQYLKRDHGSWIIENNNYRLFSWQDRQNLALRSDVNYSIQLEKPKIAVQDIAEEGKWDLKIEVEKLSQEVIKFIPEDILQKIDVENTFFDYELLFELGDSPWDSNLIHLKRLDEDQIYLQDILKAYNESYGKLPSFNIGKLIFYWNIKNHFSVTKSLNLRIKNPQFYEGLVIDLKNITQSPRERDVIAVRDKECLNIRIEKVWNMMTGKGDGICYEWKVLEIPTWLHLLGSINEGKDQLLQFYCDGYPEKDTCYWKGDLRLVCGKDYLTRRLILEIVK